MLLPRAVKVYFASEPTNMRQSFDGLSNQVRHVLGHDPLSGHVFIFLNRRRNQVKLLLWTRGGFTIVHKRLERGTFAFARAAQALYGRRRGQPLRCDLPAGGYHRLWLQHARSPLLRQSSRGW